MVFHLFVGLMAMRCESCEDDVCDVYARFKAATMRMSKSKGGMLMTLLIHLRHRIRDWYSHGCVATAEARRIKQEGQKGTGYPEDR